jgi:coatomer protein complex subunit gamma
MEGGKRKDDDYSEEDVSPFAGLQTNVVVREANIFNDRQLNSIECSRVLTKILYLISQGEKFSSEDTTQMFFGVTKLFQSPDVHLRRLIYLVIKELTVDSDESLIVVSSLSKDMTSQVDLFRGNSIRVLAKIMDANMVTQIDRFLQQAIVNQNPFIVVSTLVAAQHILYKGGLDTVKRWVNEIQEALSSRSLMVQYHALALMYNVKKSDRLAINKMVAGLARAPPKGAMAQCLQIRIVASVLMSQPTPDNELLGFLTNSLRNKNFMVMYEAARSICKIPTLSSVQMSPAVLVLHEFLSSPIPAQKFAAVRTLSEVVTKYPLLVQVSNVELERLIPDPNRSIATLAITTLLKTGVEANVERLMNSIAGFMSEISDDFKVVLVNAIETLCLKFHSKYPVVLSFLSSALREEGGFKYKEAIVNTMVTIIEQVKDAQETALEHFCEYIEDCEFPELSIKILNLLGEMGPKTVNPAKFIRFVFNRVILETSSVRSAAVTSLCRFGASVPHLKENVIVLLKRCLGDNDDEVRDRAVFSINLLSSGQQAQELLKGFEPDLRSLEYSLQQYTAAEAAHAEAFDLAKDLQEPPVEEVAAEEEAVDEGVFASSAPVVVTAAGTNSEHVELLNSIDEIKALGELYKSCPMVELTEPESEYFVSLTKHIYPNHVVFQFFVTNNMEDQQLENVTVELEPEEEDWEEEFAIPEPVLKFRVEGCALVVFTRPEGGYSSGSMTATLKFEVKDVDSEGEPLGDGIEDQYQLEDVEVAEADFMIGDNSLGLVAFRSQWESLGNSNEMVKKYSLGLDSLQAAVDAVIELLAMSPCEASGTVPDDARSHAANLCGNYLGGIRVFCRAGFMMGKNGVTLKIAIRSEDTELNKTLVAAIR